MGKTIRAFKDIWNGWGQPEIVVTPTGNNRSTKSIDLFVRDLWDHISDNPGRTEAILNKLEGYRKKHYKIDNLDDGHKKQLGLNLLEAAYGNGHPEFTEDLLSRINLANSYNAEADPRGYLTAKMIYDKALSARNAWKLYRGRFAHALTNGSFPSIIQLVGTFTEDEEWETLRKDPSNIAKLGHIIIHEVIDKKIRPAVPQELPQCLAYNPKGQNTSPEFDITYRVGRGALQLHQAYMAEIEAKQKQAEAKKPA